MCRDCSPGHVELITNCIEELKLFSKRRLNTGLQMFLAGASTSRHVIWQPPDPKDTLFGEDIGDLKFCGKLVTQGTGL
jgi:hypothetical protein